LTGAGVASNSTISFAEDAQLRWQSSLAGMAFLLGISFAAAVEFRPYPRERITEVQWQSYFDTIKAAHGGSMEELRQHRLVVFYDSATATSYAFTQPAHAAHPAWVARRIVSRDGVLNVEQIGYFAGAEAPFAKLFAEYEATNKRMIEEMKRNQGKR
jgi:hypothetical protein